MQKSVNTTEYRPQEWTWTPGSERILRAEGVTTIVLRKSLAPAALRSCPWPRRLYRCCRKTSSNLQILFSILQVLSLRSTLRGHCSRSTRFPSNASSRTVAVHNLMFAIIDELAMLQDEVRLLLHEQHNDVNMRWDPDDYLVR